ncbi:hypothetical protein Q5752_006080 [Cryptotrichosporon argae]
MRTAVLGLAGAAVALAGPEQHVFDSAPAPKVNVSLHVMSRCPDARLCESVFDEVLHTNGVMDKVALDMHYIATLEHAHPPLSCKHGPAECAGNAHQLCASAHLSQPDFYAVLSCMNYGAFPGSIGDERLVEKCVRTVGAEWAAVGECITGSKGVGGDDVDEVGDDEEDEDEDGDESDDDDVDEWSVDEDGSDYFDEFEQDEHELEEDEDDWWTALGPEARKLLLANVKETATRNVTKSCTIRIDSTLVRGRARECVVDGGVWTGCDDGHTAADFVRVIEAEWAELQRGG